MRLAKTDQLVMLSISVFVLIAISVMYIKHHIIEHRKMNCRAYAHGVIDTLTLCATGSCDAEIDNVKNILEITHLEFEHDIIQTEQFKYKTLYKELYYRCEAVK